MAEQLEDENEQYPKWIEVTADYFSKELWTHVGDKKLDSFLAWIEIQSFIKGSLDALIEKRYLTCEEYLALGKKQAPMFYEEDDTKELIYKCFKAYEKHKMEQNSKQQNVHYFDGNDFVHHIYHRLQEQKKSPVVH